MAEKTILVVPAYNEAKTIGRIVNDGLNVKVVDEIVVVDDGSEDDTYERAIETRSNPGRVFVLRHRINLGKGAALKTGCEAAVKLGADIIVTADSDGQHPMEHITKMVELIKKNDWQVVFSVRIGGDKMTPLRRLGTWAINFSAYHLFGLKLRDLWCGFRAIRADCLPLVMWNKSNFAAEVEMAVKIAAGGLRYGECAYPNVGDSPYEGATIIHGLQVLMWMLIWRIGLRKIDLL